MDDKQPTFVPLASEHIMQFFSYDHLPPHLREVSQPFAELAIRLLNLPRNPERTVALRKLLEAKDAAVRARLADVGTPAAPPTGVQGKPWPQPDANADGSER